MLHQKVHPHTISFEQIYIYRTHFLNHCVTATKFRVKSVLLLWNENQNQLTQLKISFHYLMGSIIMVFHFSLSTLHILVSHFHNLTQPFFKLLLISHHYHARNSFKWAPNLMAIHQLKGGIPQGLLWTLSYSK